MSDEAKANAADEASTPSPAGVDTPAPAPAGDSEQKAGAKAKKLAVWKPKALKAPVRLSGAVVHGFGRGSKMLGIPTANLAAEALEGQLTDAHDGVYFGWACVNQRPVYKTVLSIGWNPYFKNTQRTVEPYLMHTFEEDFYGETLHLLICGFLREQADFSSLEELIAAINKDIAIAGELLDGEEYSGFASDDLFPAAPSQAASE
mmetsp:Transcript_87679/g.179116  ORF Transcript_87679/g.179116 Transcript_87679/m.179116 type:complete len:204 (+) Transcript_87679:108-719(+)